MGLNFQSFLIQYSIYLALKIQKISKSFQSFLTLYSFYIASKCYKMYIKWQNFLWRTYSAPLQINVYTIHNTVYSPETLIFKCLKMCIIFQWFLIQYSSYVASKYFKMCTDFQSFLPQYGSYIASKCAEIFQTFFPSK